MTVSQIFFALLRSEVCGEQLDGKIKSEIKPDIFNSLYAFSKRMELAHLVGAALFKNGLISDTDENAALFRKQQFQAVRRYEQMKYEQQLACGILEQEKIQYIPLKGAVIRDFYPEPWMRTSCDIDILVHQEDLKQAVKSLTEKLGYRFEEEGGHDVSLFSKNKTHIELHYELVEDKYASSAHDILISVWDSKYSYLPDTNRSLRMMTDEMFYFYHIAHIAKHIEEGGCGIRPILDLWLLDKNEKKAGPGKISARDMLLEKGNLLDFANICRRLSEVWFSGAEPDDTTSELQEYIFSGGVYGTVQNHIAIHKRKRGGGAMYALKKIFLPYEIIKHHYPILQKHKWLTPLFEIRRWFKLIFCGGIKRSVRELQINKNTTSEQSEKIADLLRKIGL